MENFDRENIDELLEIRQIRQYFPLSKICAVRYSNNYKLHLKHIYMYLTLTKTQYYCTPIYLASLIQANHFTCHTKNSKLCTYVHY